MIDNQQLRSMRYWAHLREDARLNKEAGKPPPNCKDRVIATMRSCNVLRIHDRTTKHFRAIYERHGNGLRSTTLFNIGVYRYFGTTDFADALGWLEDWNPDAVAQLALSRQKRGLKVWTSAYISSPGSSTAPKAETVCGYLTGLWENRVHIANVAFRTKCWRDTHEAMMELPGFSNFMGKEVGLDAQLTHVLPQPVDGHDWTPAGPGAERGLNRLHSRPVDMKLTQAQCLREILELRDRLQPLLRPHMPILSAADVQWLCCEYDKYRRVKFDGAPIRRKYTPYEKKPERVAPAKEIVD